MRTLDWGATVVLSCQGMGLVAINYLGFQRMGQANLPRLDVAHRSDDVNQLQRRRNLSDT